MRERPRERARRLLEALASDRLPFLSANYTADCLVTMSDDFEFADNAVEQAIEFVADDSHPPTEHETEAALAQLG